MSYGFQVFDASSNLLMSTTDIGGIFVEKIILPVANSSTKTYNTDGRFINRVLMSLQVGSGSHDWTVDTIGGYPRLNWTAKAGGLYPRATTLLVFAT